MILAHNYQVPEVQDVADFVGDSLGLSREAAATDAEAIVFCGVHFMAETAAILAPGQDRADPRPRRRLLARRIDHRRSAARLEGASIPARVVVSYVNTTAEVKAESDYCCTSGNAKAVIEAIPEDQEILFLPDLFLGVWLERVDRPQAADLDGRVPRPRGHPARRHRALAATRRPTPSCSSTPSAAARASAWPSATSATHILSTEGMVNFAKSSPKKRFLVATETGILHRLSKEAPEKRFEAISERAICKYMKMITLEKLRDSLRDWKHVVTVEPEIAARARGAIDRMVAIT